jgi:predicted transcriptional regulator
MKSAKIEQDPDMLTGRVNDTEEKVMQTAKQEVEQLLKNLPDDSSYEDIQYHLYVLEKIKRGQASIAQGRGVSHEEARERLSKWLKP